MSEKEIKTEGNINNAKNVEQIRNIIFGTQIKEFDSKLIQLNLKLKSIESNLTQMIHLSHTKLKAESERSFALIDKRMESWKSMLEQERRRDKEQMNIRDIHLQKQLSTQNEFLLKKLQFMKEYMEDEKKLSDEKIHRIQKDLDRELEVELHSLSQNKLSRTLMSEMFLDIAMRLQNTTVSDVLEEGINTGN